MLLRGVVLVGAATLLIAGGLARGGRYPTQVRVGMWSISKDTACSAAITVGVFGLLAGGQAFARVIHWWAWLATLGPLVAVAAIALVRARRAAEWVPEPLPKWRQI